MPPRAAERLAPLAPADYHRRVRAYRTSSARLRTAQRAYDEAARRVEEARDLREQCPEELRPPVTPPGTISDSAADSDSSSSSSEDDDDDDDDEDDDDEDEDDDGGDWGAEFVSGSSSSEEGGVVVERDCK